ncbi:NAD(P)H-binding protein [Aeromicrobium sp. IC_218]|uniref:NAD(P)-dependent oxidoreductase n=1 Tax=Aeromicrobium sp. IC_218 TaxID=2545468 RepID=UPI00103AD7B6|nr:NAD(P)H-binding protein [Aeromicrobium sp. IC_218]TCI97554.1 NAD-dependent epimerase/dehydratase family protein [Aeromicrobium sp. IC_218]
MSSITVIGGTGYAGSAIVREAAARGHQVTSVSRNLPEQRVDGVTYETGSVQDDATVAKAAQADVLVVATHADLPDGPNLDELTPGIAAAAKQHGATLAFVGGAGSSFVAEGGPRVIETPDFPDAFKPEASAHARVLEWLEANGEGLDWFYVSPAGGFGAYAPVEKKGTYRTGGDVLVVAEDGSSTLGADDLALAFVDEIEQANHRGARFTVGY